MIDVSFLIPAYNVQDTIGRCLDSILAQKFSGYFEIIIVNDGSTDNTLSILENYSQEYSLITYISHEVNSKLSQARKSAYEIAKGKYIWHVDADDWIEPNSLQKLYDYAELHSCDVLLFNYYRVYRSNKLELINLNIQNEELSEKNNLYQYFTGGTCLKFILKDIVSTNYELYKTNLNSGEDFLFCSELFFNSSNIGYLNLPAYSYYANTSSLTSTISNEEICVNYSKLLISYKRIVRKHIDIQHPLFEKIILNIKKDVIRHMSKLSAVELVNNVDTLYTMVDNVNNLLEKIKVNKLKKNLSPTYWFFLTFQYRDVFYAAIKSKIKRFLRV